MRIDFVDGDTWVGLYFDGELVEEGHSISAWQAVKLLAYADRKVEIGERWEASGNWLDTLGHFPVDLKDVVVMVDKDTKTIGEIWENEG